MKQKTSKIGIPSSPIREHAIKRTGNQFGGFGCKGRHNNTLFIQLSRNGRYWNVNSAGIFKKRYSRRKPKVYSKPAVGSGIGTDTTEVNSGQSEGATAPAGNSSETSDGKGNALSADKQAAGVGSSSMEDGLSESLAAGGTEPDGRSALERIPGGENGQPDFEAVDAATAWEGLVEDSFDAAEAESYALGLVKEIEKEVGRARKRCENVKVTRDREQYKREREEARKALEKSERSLEHWKAVAGIPEASRKAAEEAERARLEEERLAAEEEARERGNLAKIDKRYRDVYDEVKDSKDALARLRSQDPESIDEAAALVLSRHKLLYNDAKRGGISIKHGYKSETGYGEGERRKLFSMFASEEKGGQSVQRLAEDAMKETCDEHGIPYDYDAAYTALLDVLQQAYVPSDITKYIQNRRMQQAVDIARAERERDRESADEWAYENFGMSYDEYQAHEEVMAEAARAALENFDEAAYNDFVADEFAKRKEYERRDEGIGLESVRGAEGEESAGEGPDSGGGGEVLHGEGAVEASGAGKDGEGRGLSPADGGDVPGSPGDARAEVTSTDPRTMPDDEKVRRGDMLRNAIAIEVAPEQIVATKELSARKAAEQWWDENVPEPAFYDTEVGEVEINKNSIESSLAHKYGQMKLDAITSLIEGFKNAVYLGTMPDFSRQEGVNNHFFAYPIMYNGKRCYVFCRAMEDANKNRLYVHEVFVSDKIKKGDTLQTAASQPHGGIALYRDILANVLEYERKVTNSASDKQEKGAESSVQTSDNKGEQTVQSAVEAASAQVNTTPTPAQAEAGNYKKGHVTIGEFDITIENPAGSVRKGVDADGKEWSTTMANTYGYIKGTESVDGDHIDVFLHQNMDEWNGRKVYVVDQTNPDGSFDEHKVMLGFNDKDEAMTAYLANYDNTWADTHPGIRISETNIEDFNKWIQSSHRKTKPFAEYKSIRDITRDVDQTPTNVDKEGVVVDGEGKPLTLYHGTPNDVELSDLEMGHTRAGGDEAARYNGEGISFTPNRDVAVDYASDNGGEGKVFEVNVALKNPYYTLGVANFTPEEAAEFTASLRAKGHDGIINYQSKAMREAGAVPNEVIVFDVKSAAPVDKPASRETGPAREDNGKAEASRLDQKEDGSVGSAEAGVGSSSMEDGLLAFARSFGEGVEGVPEVERRLASWLGERSIEELADLDADMLRRVAVSAGLDEGKAWALRMAIDRATPKDRLCEVFEERSRRKRRDAEDGSVGTAEEGSIPFHRGGDGEADRVAYEAAKGMLEAAGVPVVEVGDAEAKAVVETRGDERLMGSRTDRKMAEVAEYYADKELDGNARVVVDVFSGKRDNAAIEIGREDNSRLVVIQQGRENKAGAKHSLFRHYGTRSNYYNIEEIALIPRIIENGSRNVDGKTVAYDYNAEDGTRLRVTTEIKGGREVFTNFIAKRKPQAPETQVPFGDTQTSAGVTGTEVSDAKVDISEEKNKPSDDVRYLRDSGGVVYGWTVGGKVYLNRDAMNPETPLHEYTHLWDEMVRRENPELWERGKELMRETPLWEEVMNDPDYADIRGDEDAVASEVHSRLTGKRGKERIKQMMDEAKGAGRCRARYRYAGP